MNYARDRGCRNERNGISTQYIWAKYMSIEICISDAELRLAFLRNHRRDCRVSEHTTRNRHCLFRSFSASIKKWNLSRLRNNVKRCRGGRDKLLGESCVPACTGTCTCTCTQTHMHVWALGKWGWCYHRDTRTPIIDHLVAMTFADYMYIVYSNVNVRKNKDGLIPKECLSIAVCSIQLAINLRAENGSPISFQVAAKADWFLTLGLYNRTRAKKSFLSSFPQRAMLRSRK